MSFCVFLSKNLEQPPLCLKISFKESRLCSLEHWYKRNHEVIILLILTSYLIPFNSNMMLISVMSSCQIFLCKPNKMSQVAKNASLKTAKPADVGVSYSYKSIQANKSDFMEIHDNWSHSC